MKNIYVEKKRRKKLIQFLKFLNGLLWMAVPVLIIAATLYGCITYMAAILLVILYHFIAMHIVIMM